jgi:Zn-dependent metalloprotease
VHFGQAFQNAFWDESLNQAAFGDAFVADDVVAHEMTHGVTVFRAPAYYRRSALNESFSDVFGEASISATAGNRHAGGALAQGEDLGLGSDPQPDEPERLRTRKSRRLAVALRRARQRRVHTNSGVPTAYR